GASLQLFLHFSIIRLNGYYRSIIPEHQHKVGKDLTFYIEGFNTTIRARVSRLVRKILSFSKFDKWHQLAIAWFFWQFNLERQPYM
ncbi:MAG: IS1 family transposase, partial [Bacteroidota bacterium]